MGPDNRDRTVIAAILTASALAFAFLIWLIYFRGEPQEYSAALDAVPGLNALLNGMSAACICAAFACIRLKRVRAHAALMIAAFVFSTFFLIGYVVYHAFHGDTSFTGTGVIRTAYFFILVSHIACTVFALPLILTAFFFALTRRFETHRKVVRFTLPLWLYVSVTGVTIYFLLRGHS